MNFKIYKTQGIIFTGARPDVEKPMGYMAILTIGKWKIVFGAIQGDERKIGEQEKADIRRDFDGAA